MEAWLKVEDVGFPETIPGEQPTASLGDFGPFGDAKTEVSRDIHSYERRIKKLIDDGRLEYCRRRRLQGRFDKLLSEHRRIKHLASLGGRSKKLKTLVNNEAPGQRVIQPEVGKFLENTRLRRDLKIAHEERQSLRRELSSHKQKLAEKDEKIEKLQHELTILRKKIFGKSAERGLGQEIARRHQKERNKQRAPKKHSAPKRRSHEHLPVEVQHAVLTGDEMACKQCGKCYVDLGQDDISEMIEMKISAYRRQLRRHKYRSMCRCAESPRFKRAPLPAKLMPRGLIGDSLWEHILVEKYMYQMPIFRILQSLRASGVNLSTTTINDGLWRLWTAFRPFEAHLIEQSRSEHHWHCDETGWAVYEGGGLSRSNRKWYLWTIVSKTVSMFYVKKSRGADVVNAHFGETACGIISSDRFSVYRKFEMDKRFIVAYCWAHTRRDFVRILDSHPELESWACWWMDAISCLYATNNRRVASRDDAPLHQHLTARIGKILAIMDKRATKELQRKNLKPTQLTVLRRLKKHWAGLTVFVNNSEIPMDNNKAERSLRLEVVGRKNYNGSGAEWSASFAALMFSLLQTLKIWQINERLWLREVFAHLKAGHQDQLGELLPWKLSSEKRAALALTPATNSS